MKLHDKEKIKDMLKKYGVIVLILVLVATSQSIPDDTWAQYFFRIGLLGLSIYVLDYFFIFKGK